MIPSNAALVEEYWEPLLVLRSEQRRAAGREPLLEQQSEGQPGYLGVSLLPRRHHRAPITATRHTDIPPIGILPTNIQAIRAHPVTSVPRPTDTRATRATRFTQFRRAMNTMAMRGTPLIRVPWAMDYPATWDTSLILAHQATNIGTARLILPRPVPVPDISSMATP